MDCNKDEAHRAKKVAEDKMLKNDFEGARKIALKAKRLYPELDNISQLISVCDIHCAAQKTIYNAGKDLYGILQVENAADDTTIRKQYRKLALTLHPDKNKFPGAEAAFKLIAEANMILSDRVKRLAYDIKCRDSAKASVIRIQTDKKSQSYAGQKTEFKSAPGVTVNHGQQSTSHLSFWTQFPFCGVKYQYYIESVNRPLRCQTCSKLFLAYDIGPQGFSGGAKGKAQSVNLGSNSVSRQKKGDEAEKVNQNIKKDEVTKPRVNSVQKPMETEKKMASETSEIGFDKKQAAGGGVNGGPGANKKRRKVAVESISMSSDEKEAASGGGEFTSQKRSKLADVSMPNSKPKLNREAVTPGGDLIPDSEPVLVDCADQDFTNFDKDKEEHCFSAGQIWACYDSLDSMPRFYAQIKKVYSSKIRLRITWFESDPDNELEVKWVKEGLPVGCGKFVFGQTEETNDRLMFSHQVVIKKVSRSSYVISPQKGEIWAVFKDWDINWSLDLEKHTEYKFDIVEIVEADNDCISVGLLLKVKGFVSVFQRSIGPGIVNHKIRSNDWFRFSHRVPFAILTGGERVGVPVGSFELDMASLPNDFEEYCSYYSNIEFAKEVKASGGSVNTPKKRVNGVGKDSMFEVRRSPRGLKQGS
ncbi:uncharacterized protein LOC143587648 [Bidens hawaiensis]|uniref:uncharacterized protein LOC143587648 n=1 Tax=Bidens hawaiensis TaxID=980011 RepID=UPI00404AD9CA